MDDVVFSSLNEQIQFDNYIPSSIQAHLLDNYEFDDANWIKTSKSVVNHNISISADDIYSKEKLQIIILFIYIFNIVYSKSFPKPS